MLTHVTSESFEKEVGKAKGLVIVDFWAEWCGPCKRYGPIFEDVSKEHGDKAKFVKVDVEEAGDIAANFGVQGIPTTIFFKNGEPVERSVGMLSKNDLLQKIKELA